MQANNDVVPKAQSKLHGARAREQRSGKAGKTNVGLNSVWHNQFAFIIKIASLLVGTWDRCSAFFGTENIFQTKQA